MAFRGYFAVNGVEIANSSRLSSHLGAEVPTSDIGIFTNPDEECALVPSVDYPGGYEVPEDAEFVSPGMFRPTNGMRRFGPGLIEVDEFCWGPIQPCPDGCRSMLGYDDSWTGLQEFLGDNTYRPELAPWYVSEQPESGEFIGLSVMKVDGLDTTPVERTLTPLIGSGSVASASRNPHRTISFEAVLIGCTHVGLVYGLRWLTCLLLETTYDSRSTLRYLSAHPEYSAVDPAKLVREANGLVLTAAPTVVEEYIHGGKQHQQATMYRVRWEMATCSPYAWLPSTELLVDWDEVIVQPINWIHTADCGVPESCLEMPVMFSTECVPEEIAVVNTPPPVCGGCLPVGEITMRSYRVPTMTEPFECRSTAVTTTIRNLGESSLNLQAFWRVCGTDVRCEDNQWPLQISGLPAGAELVLDGITGRFWANYDERIRQPIGVVATPNGAPWRPPLIDRHTCWDFVTQAASSADFEVTITLSDREV